MRCLMRLWPQILFLGLIWGSGAVATPADRGRYLAKVGDCVICHTAPGADARPYAGGYPLHAAFGTVFSTNITPDEETGIGHWTADQFYRAMHRGIAADGHHLYPAFPYPYFDLITRADSDALFAYLQTLPALRQPPPKNKLVFPTNIRWLLTFWNWLFVPQTQFKADPARSAEWNRGGILVNGLAHCGGCHTPKDALFSDKSGQLLQGTTIDGWHAPNLTSSMRTGLGQWSLSDIAQYLKTGKNRFGWVVGSMRAVVAQSTSLWSDADRHAVAVYLKSLPAAPEPSTKLPGAQSMQRGQAVYVARCAACHVSGTGDYPSLAANSVVRDADPTTLLRILLKGSQSLAIPGQQHDFSMPAFAVLSDGELADLTTFLRHSWGNSAAPVSEETVRQARALLAQRD